MEGFSLSKAYLDVVDPAGRCAIVYGAALAWGPLSLRWESFSVFEQDRPPVHRSAWMPAGTGRGAAPADWKVGGYTCRASRKTGACTADERARLSRLGVHVSCEPWCGPFAARLLETPAGTLDWSCDAAGADAAVETEDGVFVRGAGYAEHLELRMLPWKMPIDELRWGRWHCSGTRHAIAWIDWRGERPMTLVLENGTPRAGATVGNASISWSDQSLRLAAALGDPPKGLAARGGKAGGDTCRAGSETLYSRTLTDVLGGAGPLLNQLPASWRSVEDRKKLTTGVLGDESGWAIHETVTFPTRCSQRRHTEAQRVIRR